MTGAERINSPIGDRSKAYVFIDYCISEPGVPGYEPVRRRIEEVMVEVAQGGEIAPIVRRLEQDANKILDEFRL